jgi:hypothetical protein
MYGKNNGRGNIHTEGKNAEKEERHIEELRRNKTEKNKPNT